MLIGVSDYDDEAGIADLKGPANDVALLRNVLESRGVEDIRVLADGIAGASRPVREAIVGGFASLAETSGAGDLVIIHMSGHGTRQRDVSGDEADGLDEVFLPADVTPAEPGTGIIPNALVDDEIGAALDRIRATGADVWLIMDSCNSGTGVRAAEPATAARFVDPAVLGVDVAATGAADRTWFAGQDERRPSDGETPIGGLMAFYAAQSSEVAREIDFTARAQGEGTSPGGTPTANGGWFGLFTAKLAARLETVGATSYRQLFQAVLSDINDSSLPGAARLQTPFWEGTMADAVVFGDSRTAGLRQYMVTDASVAAGLVHGVTDGTLMALVDDPTSPLDQALGYAQAFDVSATTASLRPVGEDCTIDSGAPCAASGQLPPQARFARILSRRLDFVARLNAPFDLSTGAPLARDHALSVSLEAAIETLNEVAGEQVAIDPEQYSVDVVADQGSLWFGYSAVMDGVPAGLQWHPERGPPLESILARIVAAERLAAVLDDVSRTSSTLNPNPVEIRTSWRASDLDELSPPGSEIDPRTECGRIFRARSLAEPVPLEGRPAIKQCDEVALSGKGLVHGARDVNRLHIDTQFCVHAAYTRIEDQARAVPLGDAMVMCSDCPSPDGAGVVLSAGVEKLFVLVTDAPANADQLNLVGTVENCGDAGATRASPNERVRQFLAGLTTPGGTRGAMAGFGFDAIWVEPFIWEILPREVAFSRLRSGPAE